MTETSPIPAATDASALDMLIAKVADLTDRNAHIEAQLEVALYFRLQVAADFHVLKKHYDETGLIYGLSHSYSGLAYKVLMRDLPAVASSDIVARIRAAL